MTVSEPVRWSVHPLRSEPVIRSVILLTIILGVATLFARTFGSSMIGFLSGGLLIVTVSRYLLPTRYVVDADGVRISNAGAIRRAVWKSIKRVDRHPDGFFLSPYRNPHRLDTFRGWFLRLPNTPDGGLIHDAIQNFVEDNAL